MLPADEESGSPLSVNHSYTIGTGGSIPRTFRATSTPEGHDPPRGPFRTVRSRRRARPIGRATPAATGASLARNVAVPVAAPFDGIVADVHVGTDVLDGLGVEVDARDRLRDLPALATHRIERDVLAVDLVLILREHLANAVVKIRGTLRVTSSKAPSAYSSVFDHLDRNLQSVGIGLQQGGEVGGVRVALAERVRNRGVRLPEVPAERARVDLAEPHDLPVGVRQLPRDLAERVLVVGGEHLPDVVAALAQHTAATKYPRMISLKLPRWATPKERRRP